MIASSAIIDPKAKIAANVKIGNYSIIGANVEINSGTEIGSHVVIKGPTKIGKNNKIYQFASIGEDPQDRKYSGEPSTLIIGDNNSFREFCTIHRGTEQGGGKTVIGNDNLFMNYTHVAHDCIIGNHVTFSNNASVAGHVLVDDHASLGGFVIVRQFCLIGKYSFAAGGSVVTKDILPFVMVSGYPAEAHGLNSIGLERHGFSPEAINELRRAYKIIFRKNLTMAETLNELTHLSDNPTDEVMALIEFLKNSSRGIVR